MNTIDGLIDKLEKLKRMNSLSGDTPVLIDTGSYLTKVEDVDLGGSDEGVIVWCGDRVEL